MVGGLVRVPSAIAQVPAVQNQRPTAAVESGAAEARATPVLAQSAVNLHTPARERGEFVR